MSAVPVSDERQNIMSDPLAQLSAAGVSVWIDDISRDRLRTGNLADLIRDRHVVGVTSNPTIFAKSIENSASYEPQIHDLALRGVDVGEALRAITAYDIRWACDVLRPAYDASDGVDGRVSIEVDPRIAHDTDKTTAETRALWWLVDRPNLFVKIPATVEGLPSIAQGLAEGISINVTLIFSLKRYEQVIDAFFDGMERALKAGHDLSKLASVASFFVSRVDTEVDKRLEKIGGEATQLKAQAAIANARLAFKLYEERFSSERWQRLAAAGAKPQRPLWASTSTKDPSLPDTIYITELVAPGVVNTMPEATMQATYDHGEIPNDSVRGHYADAQAVLDKLAALGVDYDDVVGTLEREGVEKFANSWNDLIATIQKQLDEKAGN
jgi:transaldolase